MDQLINLYIKESGISYTIYNSITTKLAQNWWRSSLEPGDRYRILFIPFNHVSIM